MSRSADLRNLVFIGHGGTGKTTIVDGLAHLTGVTSRPGSVDQGSSISDHEPEELERKHSFTAAIVHGTHRKKPINIIDTPGYPEFVAEVTSCLHAAETAAIVVAATSKVTYNTRVLWNHAHEAGIARILVVTRNDGENTSFAETVAAIQEAFGDVCVPVVFPDGNAADFSALCNVLDMDSVPDAHKDQAQTHYGTLVERVAEADEELMMQYLEEGELSEEDVRKNLALAIRSGAVVPIISVDPRDQKGLDTLLDFVQDFCPSIEDTEGAPAVGADDAETTVKGSADDPLVAQVFKIISDQHVGRISYIKVHSGTLKGDSALHVEGVNKPIKLNGINLIQAREGLKSTDSAGPGDIVAVTKIEDFIYGGTVSGAAGAPQIVSPVLPKPMVSLAVVPKSQGDEQRLGDGLRKLGVEDPTFVVRREDATHELLIEGLSDLHLQIMTERLKRRYKVEIDTHLPKIPYKETVAAKAEGHHRHKKQSGGRGQFGECFIRIAPSDRGSGFEFHDKIVGGAIPRNLIPAVEKGMRESLAAGPLAGCEMVDFNIELYDGKFHPVDSDEASFKMAGQRALRDAFLKAKPQLLEPVMDLHISVPSRFMGDITGDVNSRRGRIVGMDSEGEVQKIHAQIPLSEVQTYSTELRSVTAGEGSYTMEFYGYEQVPPHVQDKVIAENKKEQEES